MNDIQCFRILSYVAGSLVLCIFMLLCGHFLGGRSYSRYKNVPFESGIESIGNARTKFSVKFYLVAIMFVIFDIEGMYLYLWAVSVRETGWIGFIEICIFILVLLVSLIYLIREGMFEWINRSLNFNINYRNYLSINILKFFRKI